MRQRCYRVLGWIRNGSSGVLAFAIATKFWNPEAELSPSWVAAGLTWAQSYSALLILVFFLTMTVSDWLRRWVGSPRDTELARLILEEFHQVVFGGSDDDLPAHHRRATLFKHVRWRWALCKWPWSGWLVPVARSGHTEQRSTCVFRAPPSKPDDAQGIAGRVWSTRKVLTVTDLPDINSPATRSDNQARREYCKRTFVSEEWLRDRLSEPNPKPVGRAFWGAPVENENDVWGVVVLDSRNAEKNRGGPQIYPTLSALSRILGKTLERGSS